MGNKFSEHLFMVGIIIFFTVLGIISAQSAFGMSAQGRSGTLDKAVENSHIAAHFQCNKKGLWADLDQLKVTKVEKKGSKNRPERLVSVSFPCKADYSRYPTTKENL